MLLMLALLSRYMYIAVRIGCQGGEVNILIIYLIENYYQLIYN